MPTIAPCFSLLPGKERPQAALHPWVFSGALAQADNVTKLAAANPGQAVRLNNAQGQFLAWAQCNPASKIRLRVLSWLEHEFPDEAWYEDRLLQALACRLPYMSASTTAIRLVFSEADNLPGLIVDRMDKVLVIQLLTHGMDAMRQTIVRSLIKACGQCLGNLFALQAIVEKSDGDGRKLEGLPPAEGLLWGELTPDPLVIKEQNHLFQVDLHGQKTGFYTDQRENRFISALYARNARVLDACTYSGAFSVYAQAAGAKEITLMDSSQAALRMAKLNLALNNTSCPVHTIEGDVFKELRKLVASGQQYDLIILDPPKLAPNRASLDRAATAYKDLNLQALKLLAPGGILATFSCSGIVTAENLRLWTAWAAKDLGKQVQILHQLHQSACHPILLSFPESEYLKGFILKLV